jgi:hypothetical protein
MIGLGKVVGEEESSPESTLFNSRCYHRLFVNALTLSLLLHGLLIVGLIVSVQRFRLVNYVAQPNVINATLIASKVDSKQNSSEEDAPSNLRDEIQKKDHTAPILSSKEDKQNVDRIAESIDDILVQSNRTHAYDSPITKTSHISTHEKDPFEIESATTSYMKQLELNRLRDLAAAVANTHKNPLLLKTKKNAYEPLKTADDLLIEKIQVEVDCTTTKGAVFNFLSRNKGVVIEDRDLPNLSQQHILPKEGIVRCRNNSAFREYVDKRVYK